MADTTKRFEDWEQKDCNECARYWDSSCDGVKKGSQKPCNSFLATRSVVIPLKIERLRKAVKGLCLSVSLLAVAMILHVLTHVLG